MESSYNIEDINLSHKKRRLKIAIAIALISLIDLTDPSLIYMVLLDEAIFVPMIILWSIDYKDARIIHDAYIRAVKSEDNK